VQCSGLQLLLQAQRLREQAEKLFQKHRDRGGYPVQQDQSLPKEQRDALWELKSNGQKLWKQANTLVKVASKQVLARSQVCRAHFVYDCI